MTYGEVKILTRPKGERPRALQLPKGVDLSRVVAVVGRVNDHVADRLWLNEGSASRIRKDLLPERTDIDKSCSSSHDAYELNGCLIPIVGKVAVKVRMGTCQAEVTFGVVHNMPVSVLLGTDYTDVHISIFYCIKGCKLLLNGEVIRTLHRGRTLAPIVRHDADESLRSQGASLPVCLVKSVLRPPVSRGYVLVTTKFPGNGFVWPLDRVYERHQVQVVPGPLVCRTDQSWVLEVLITSCGP